MREKTDQGAPTDQESSNTPASVGFACSLCFTMCCSGERHSGTF